MLVVIGAALWAAWTMIRTTASLEDRHTAQTILIAVVAAFVGYLVKK